MTSKPAAGEPSPGAAALPQLLTQLRAHRGAYLWTSRPTHGFADLQEVKILGARDDGPRGILVTVEGLQPGPDGETLVRVTVPAADLGIPGAWARPPASTASGQEGLGTPVPAGPQTRLVGRDTSSPDSGPAELEP